MNSKIEKPEVLSQEVVNLLIERLPDEFKAFYFYRSAANWCQNKGFFKAAEFFKAESDDELTHAKKIEDYLVDWNVTPDLSNILKPVLEFTDLIDVIEKAYDMEYALYEGYEDTSMKVFKTGDLCVFDFLQFFRTTQKEAVAEYSDKLNVVEGTNRDSKFEMLLLEKVLFKG
jgi:ferritin